MRNLLLLLMTFIISACGSGSVPLVSNQSIDMITQEDYEQVLEKNLERSLNRQKNLSPQNEQANMYLRYNVVGLSFDVRVGLFNWRKGASSAVEFFFLQDNYVEKKQ